MKFSKIFPILALCVATFSAKTEAQEYWRVTYWPASQDTILNGVFQTGRDTSYVVGNFGKILKFTPQELSHQVSGVNTTLNAVHFPSKTTGFVAGDQGVFLRTTNGGNSWTLRSTGTTTKNLYSVFFVNPNVGYAVGDSGLILKTTNAGANWASQTWGNGTRRLSSVHATSPDTAFVAGWDGTMLRTTDGGATWIALGAGVASFRSMWFPTSLVGYAIGSSSDLVKTTDGGDTWSYLNGLSVAGGGTLVTNVTSVHFPTRDTGYVVGGGSSNVLQTTDGGATWKVAGPLSGNFAWTNGVFFSDQLNGVAVGGHRVFQHGYTPPVSPELYLPAAGATDVSLNLNLTWEVNPAASTFHLQVSTNINFSSMVFEDSTLLSATAFLEELSTSTTYYWRLRAKNPGGTSDWSDARSFTTVPPIPPAPNLTTPVSGATTVSVTPALSWGAATGAVTYNLQVSTQSNFSSLLKDTVTALTGKTLGQLANNTTHYWRVSATNAGGTSAWSTGSTFTTVPVPAAPDLSSPAQGGVNVPLSTTLNWDASANALTYRVQVSTSNTFGTTVVNDSTITGTSRAIGPLLNNTTYFWRVNAKNGGASDYSATFSFTTLPAPPAAPVLESPAADLLNAPLSLDLMWGASSGAVTYTLELSTDQTFATVLLTDSTLTGLTRSVGPLALNTAYYWRMKAKNPGGTSAWSTVRKFTTVPPAPAAPVLSLPAHNATGLTLSVGLAWAASAGAATYTVELSADSSFASLILQDSGVSGTTRTVSSLLNNKPYFWRVKAKNAGGTSAWSSVFRFTTAPLSVPTLSTPAHNAVDVSPSPSLTWIASTGASTYHVQLASDSLFSTVVINDSGLAVVTRAAGSLTPNTAYYWRVRAKSSGGVSDWSTFRKFTILAIPATPALLSPGADSASVSGSPNLIWSTVPGAATYHLQLASDSLFTTVVATNVNDSTLTVTTRAVGPLLNASAYFWRVRAKNVAGVSAFSTVRKFTVAAIAAPTLSTPAHNATGLSVTPALSWTWTSNGGSDVVAGYTLQVSTDSLFATTVTNSFGATLTRNAGPLTPNTPYYWRVMATSVSGLAPSAWTETRRFTTQALAPVPVLVSPAADTVQVSLTPTLSWTASAGAESYRLQLSTDSTFATMLLNDSTLTVTSRAAGTLQENRNYFWRVNAKNAGGVSAWSPTRRFTTLTVTAILAAEQAFRSLSRAGEDGLQFHLSKASHVRIRIYGVEGSMTTLVDAKLSAGTHRVSLPKQHEGVYLLDFQVGSFRRVLKQVH